MSGNESLVSILSQFGGVAVFGGLIWLLLRNSLADAAKERADAREERSEWLRQLRAQDADNRIAMGQLSEVLVEIRTILREKNK